MKKLLTLFFIIACAQLYAMNNPSIETITLHNGQIVPKKKFDEVWPKLKNLTNDRLKSGVHYSLYALSHNVELPLDISKEQVENAGFPTSPSLIDSDTKTIILATNAFSLSAEKRAQLEKEKPYTFDFINPVDPSEGYHEANWD